MKLFFSDVDNTLVKKGEKLSPEIKRAITQVQEHGDEFVLCSGRPIANLIRLGEELRAENIMVNYVSGYNGGTIYNLNTAEIMYENGLTKNEVNEISNILKNEAIDFLTYTDTNIVTTNLANEWAIFESELNDIPLIEAQNHEASIKVLGLVDPSQMDSKLKVIQEKLPTYTVINSTPFFIEITRDGVNKGSGLQKMQAHLAIDNDNSYVFGDALNDYEMFKVAKNRICVENAVVELKQLATYITDSVSENGVANYLNSLYKK